MSKNYSNEIIKLEFGNRKIRLVENNKPEIKPIKTKKIIKKKQNEDPFEDSYQEILRSSYIFNLRQNTLKSLNLENKKMIDKLKDEPGNKLKCSDKLYSQVPIIIKNDKFIDYNFNEDIQIHKDTIETFIKNNLNVDLLKQDNRGNGMFYHKIVGTRRRRRGTLKMQKKQLEKRNKLNNE